MLGGGNLSLLAAAALSTFMALVHTIVGERLIFAPYRKAKTKPIAPVHWGILWACWHGLSLFALVLAAMLYHFAFTEPNPALLRFYALSLVVFSGLIAYGTRLRHPAWGVFLVLAALIFMGSI